MAVRKACKWFVKADMSGKAGSSGQTRKNKKGVFTLVYDISSLTSD